MERERMELLERLLHEAIEDAEPVRGPSVHGGELRQAASVVRQRLDGIAPERWDTNHPAYRSSAGGT
jgi:hypothetical protein